MTVTAHLGLDLGKWKMGLALTDSTRTVAVAVRVAGKPWTPIAAVNAIFKALLELPHAPDRTHIHIEKPQHYGGSKAALQRDANLLSDLADRVKRELVPLGYTVTLLRPHEWKGNVKKPVHHRRVRRVLSKPEIAVLEAEDYGDAQADVWDAVGLALFGAGRTGRGGTRVGG